MMTEYLYDDVVSGTFIRRENRFIVCANIDGSLVVCHMPNPGRMRELLFPGVTVYAIKNNNPINRTDYRIIGVEREKEVILLDTARCNDVAHYLIDHQKIKGWEDHRVVKKEVTMGDSRFDLLLRSQTTGEEFPVEVKSCTLFGKKGAMFPDAVTSRGKKHIIHLGEMGRAGHAGLLILVHWSRAEWFLPDFHTDIEFAEAFRKNASYIDLKVAGIHWEADFRYPEKARLLPVPISILDKEMGNHGDYLLCLFLEQDKDIEVGCRGIMHFPAGHYVYVGSAKRNLQQRMDRHKHLRKKMHWHIDYLRQHTKYIGIIPIRTSHDWEHELAAAVRDISDWQIDRFGCTDCKCMSHLFGFHENPLHLKAFTKIEEEFEINRLNE